MSIKLEQVAMICYNANRDLTAAMGEEVSEKSWVELSDEEKASYINSVQFALDNPALHVAFQHAQWMKAKLADDWVVGEVKDRSMKKNPYLVSWDKLPKEKRVKVHLLKGIVKSVANFIE